MAEFDISKRPPKNSSSGIFESGRIGIYYFKSLSLNRGSTGTAIYSPILDKIETIGSSKIFLNLRWDNALVLPSLSS